MTGVQTCALPICNETGHVEWKTLPFNVACFSLFGCFPSSGPGCARSTFPVGEGNLPAGEHSSGLSLNFPGSPPHPARASPGPPSPSRRGRKIFTAWGARLLICVFPSQRPGPAQADPGYLPGPGCCSQRGIHRSCCRRSNRRRGGSSPTYGPCSFPDWRLR